MITADRGRFTDEDGRTLLLRGINVSGASKIPRKPDGATHIREGFHDHTSVSFVGRPFPLSEADQHFSRLAGWGFTFIRLLITWEAIEHSGPGLYDEQYIDYLRDLAAAAVRHGLSICVDPHQDMWSRFSGGDGAPGWTLEAVGFNLSRLFETGAAITHQEHGDPLPTMIWPTNSGKLAAATMFTLFFGGSDFAPRTLVDGEPAQEFLQRHYIEAIMRVARRLSGIPGVVGYGSMNEPMPGYIGWKDLHAPGGLLALGEAPTGLQGMALGAGIPQQVDVCRMGLARIYRSEKRVVNPSGLSAWKDGFDCPWKANGVWGPSASGEPVLRQPDHFTRIGGREVDFARDYLAPFVRRFADALREADPKAMLFIEGEPRHDPPPYDPGRGPPPVHAPHWYDDLLVVKKRYFGFLGWDSRPGSVVFGSRAVRRSFADQLAELKLLGARSLPGAPTFIGEFGIPFDMNRARTYRTGDLRPQVRALDRSFRAIEANLLSCAVWNYTPDNTASHGDQWNGEDFSVYAGDGKGGRALEALVRPYPRAVAGEPLRMSFDIRRRSFVFEFRHDPASSALTEIFVPRLQYPRGCRVSLSDGDCQIVPERQLLLYRHGNEAETHTIRIAPAS